MGLTETTDLRKISKTPKKKIENKKSLDSLDMLYNNYLIKGVSNLFNKQRYFTQEYEQKW